MSDSQCDTYENQIKSGMKIKTLTMVDSNIHIEYKLGFSSFNCLQDKLRDYLYNVVYSNTLNIEGYGKLPDWDVSNVNNMSGLFDDKDIKGYLSSIQAYQFDDIDISKWNTCKVTNMSKMFRQLPSTWGANFNISKWNVSKVRAMEGMFSEAESFSDLSSWNLSNVSMNSMFMGATSFNQDISKWDVSSVTSMNSMFYKASAFNSNISNWDVSSVTDMSLMFNGAKEFNQNLTMWDVTKVHKDKHQDFSSQTDKLQQAYEDAKYTLPVFPGGIRKSLRFNTWRRNADNSITKGDDYAYSIITPNDCQLATASLFTPPDVIFENKAYDYEKVYGDRLRTNKFTPEAESYVTVKGVPYIPVYKNIIKLYGQVQDWDVSNVAAGAFTNSIGSSIGFNGSTLGVGNEQGGGGLIIFVPTESKQVPKEYNYSPAVPWRWDTSKFLNLSLMFAYTGTNGPNFNFNFNANVSSWNTSKVGVMDNMSYYNKGFNGDLSNWNTSSVSSMIYMFSNALSFNQNLSNWNTGNVSDMQYMFSNATSFNSNLSNWHTGNVSDMQHMFTHASSFNNDVSKWETSKVTDMNTMFSEATSFNSNLSSWNVSNVISMQNMFYSQTKMMAINTNISKWQVVKLTNWDNFINKNTTSSMCDINGAEIVNLPSGIFASNCT